MRFYFSFSAFMVCCIVATAQQQDSLQQRSLPEITIVGQHSSSDIHLLPEIVGTNIYAGKKSSLIVLDNVQGNVVNNTMRQVAAKIPGLFIWESEGSGIQIGVAARGLSPNRSWEFNVRQNGYDISADPLGYPEAYYNPQLQSVQRIEVVRGQGALQYGSQMGGMINYILKNGNNFNKPFQFETFQTLGSYGLFDTYNAVGGKTKRWHYYAFYNRRSGNGWRENSGYSSNTLSGTVTFQATEKISITGEYTNWHSRSQQAGGLTDAQFQANPRQSLRSRNWFDLGWQTIALNMKYNIAAHSVLDVKLFNIIGDRSSIGFMPSSGITVKDTINAISKTYNPRTLNVDNYRNYGMESRYLYRYAIGNTNNALSAGVRLYTGTTRRYRADGISNTGTNYDLSLLTDTTRYSGDVLFQSQNAAAFVENIFRITPRWNVVPGMRYEYIAATASGYNNSDKQGKPIILQAQERNRGFFLFGLGTEYRLTEATKFYANATQAYRPVQFADLVTPPTTDVIDPNMTDAKGLNADFGIRGKVGNVFTFDASIFLLDYNNRVGTIKQQRVDGSFYNLRTNVGSSRAKGVEVFGEYNLTKSLFPKAARYGEASIFASYAYNDARYRSFQVISLENNALKYTNLAGKKVEYAPQHLLRTGISYALGGFSAAVQYSYTSHVYTDANNTETPTANGQNGAIPAYAVIDISSSYKHHSGFSLRAGVNNVGNELYFTRRAGGYPGPGLLPADGRTFFVAAGFVLP